MDDSKRRQLELEDKLEQAKRQNEDLKLQAEVPTSDKTPAGSNAAESDEVYQLHLQVTEMHSQMATMENQNMETVALLKQENRKLQK